MKHVALIATMLFLAACSSKSPQSDVALANAEAVAKPVPGLPVTDKKSLLRPDSLPPAFEGRWGEKPSDCDFSRSDTTGLLRLKGDTLNFYESTATAKLVGGASRYKVIADLTFRDSGKTWQARETYELTAGGTVLLRTAPALGKTYRYERC